MQQARNRVSAGHTVSKRPLARTYKLRRLLMSLIGYKLERESPMRPRSQEDLSDRANRTFAATPKR
jgi:hypothetical protein